MVEKIAKELLIYLVIYRLTINNRWTAVWVRNSVPLILAFANTTDTNLNHTGKSENLSKSFVFTYYILLWLQIVNTCWYLWVKPWAKQENNARISQHCSVINSFVHVYTISVTCTEMRTLVLEGPELHARYWPRHFQ